MALKLPLWTALAACLGSIALGAAWSQAAEQTAEGNQPEALTEFPYLPPRYAEPYLPSIAEWQAMRLTALGASTTRLTEHFSRQHLTCFATPKGLVLTLDLLPQPGWKHYAGGGKFNAPAEQVKPDLQKAIDATLRFTRNFFSEVRDKDVTIQLYLNSENAGTWTDGTLKLKE